MYPESKNSEIKTKRCKNVFDSKTDVLDELSFWSLLCVSVDVCSAVGIISVHFVISCKWLIGNLGRIQSWVGDSVIQLFSILIC